MLDAKKYMEQLLERLKNTFGVRLCYVGLQGSFLRGEATEHSDIDPMVVIDGLTIEDLRAYKKIVDEMEHPELSCGFICGTEELAGWNAMECMHLLHSTKDLHGSLSRLVPVWTKEEALNYCKIGLNNLYHALCHGYIHSDESHKLRSLPADYKAAFFVLQDLHYLRTGDFIQSSVRLAEMLKGEEKKIMTRMIALRNGAECEPEADFALLFNWCRQTMKGL